MRSTVERVSVLATRPTVLLQGEDAGATVYFWQWIDEYLTEPKVHIIERTELAPLLSELHGSLPGSAAGEKDKVMLSRVLHDGVFATLDRERDFARRLTDTLLPEELAMEIVQKSREHGGPIFLRLIPSPSCAKVPWELLIINVDGEDHRLLEFADITSDIPAGLYANRANPPAEWSPEYSTRPAVYVVDPPSFVEPAILHASQRKQVAQSWSSTVQGNPGPGEECSRRALSELLNLGPSRLFYLGHVASSSAEPGATSLLLSDRVETFGVISNVIGRGGRSNRPFSAFDAVEGTLYRENREREIHLARGTVKKLEMPTDSTEPLAGSEIWPMPARVALIACNSGGDLGHPEPFGLVMAFVNAGAGIVTATRWTLPTDFAFRATEALTSGDPQPLLDMAIRIDHEHRQDDPVSGLAAWQRERLAVWNSTSGAPTEVRESPLMWASITTYVAPNKPAGELTLEELDLVKGESNGAHSA